MKLRTQFLTLAILLAAASVHGFKFQEDGTLVAVETPDTTGDVLVDLVKEEKDQQEEIVRDARKIDEIVQDDKEKGDTDDGKYGFSSVSDSVFEWEH